jgi:hypothetical protein|tara:strand:- start:667 stop:849 length:183 start_codon:yes stop_codon:yes gene_type:complete
MHELSDDDAWQMFEKLEAKANATPHGADYEVIMNIVAANTGKTISHIRQLVKTRTVTQPN